MNIFKKHLNIYFPTYWKKSYSQSGEDLILAYLFGKLKIEKPTYLDIGANHPKFISNTYFFYKRGARGVCVEPNPYLCKQIRKYRKGDKCINAGIGLQAQKEADFYLFPKYASGLSTFSKQEALYWQETGMQDAGKIPFEKIIKVELIDINNMISQFCKEAPHLLSLDVEGLDLPILQSLDFTTHAPKVICVETLGYGENHVEFKRHDIIDFLKSKGYNIYADTYINTIFFLP